MDNLVETLHEAYKGTQELFVGPPSKKTKKRLDLIREILREYPIPKDEDQLFLQGKTGGFWFSLKDTTHIGRNDKNDLVVSSNFASKKHCILQKIDDRWHLTDPGSANGTYVNEKKIEKCYLKHGDIIEIGDQRLIFLSQSLKEEIAGAKT